MRLKLAIASSALLLRLINDDANASATAQVQLEAGQIVKLRRLLATR